MGIFHCPKCQGTPLFRGVTAVHERCGQCGFPIKEHEQGDGPAFFGILTIGTLVGIFSAIVEIKYAPSFWVHAALWVPFIIIGSLLCIRLFKAMLIAAQFTLRSEDFRQGQDR